MPANRAFSIKSTLLAALLVALTITLVACTNNADEAQDQTAASDLFGQTAPGLEPVPFLPDILSVKTRPHSPLAFSPDANEIYFSGYVVGEGRTEWIFVSKRTESGWTEPEKVDFNGGRGNGPAFSPDGDRIYFGTNGRLEPDGPDFTGIWYVDRADGGFGEVLPVTSTLDTIGFAGRPSLATNGNLYFIARGTRAEMPAVFRCIWAGDKFGAPKKLSAPYADDIVMDPWVDPEERFLLLMRDFDFTNEGYGSSDLYISYHNNDDTWTEAINLGEVVNTEHFDRSPCLAPGSEQLLFIRAIGDMFVEAEAQYLWIDAEILDRMRP